MKFPKGMAEDAVKKIRESWRATHESEDSSGRTVILYDGAEFEAITLNSTDAQFLENRKFQVAEIARAFNVPGPMIGDLSQATWSNSEQKGREFLSYTLEPWLRGLGGCHFWRDRRVLRWRQVGALVCNGRLHRHGWQARPGRRRSSGRVRHERSGGTASRGGQA